jgi:hypothetical protein
MSYGIQEGFITVECDILKSRGELPSAAQLADDLGAMTSGIKKGKHSAYIAEIYDRELRNYLEQLRQVNERMLRQRDHGYPLQQQQSIYQRRGIPIYDPQPQYPQYPPYQAPIQYPQQQQYNDPMREMTRKLERLEEERRKQLEDELREMKMQIQQGGQTNPEITMLRAQIEQMNQERMRKQDDEMSMLKMQIQQRGQGLTMQDVQTAIAQERAKITPTEIKDMIRTQLQESGRLTTTDVEMRKVQQQHQLEMAKLDEGAKTRDTIATSIKSGMASIGQAIARTAQEVGTDEKQTLQGQTSGKNMWQTPCPNCQALITAPLTAKMIRCPQCGNQYEVMPPEQTPPPEQPSPQTQPEYFPPETQAGFTVENPTPPVTDIPTIPIQREAEPIPEEGEFGKCDDCGRPLFSENIAATEGDKRYCRDCWSKHGSS